MTASIWSPGCTPSESPSPSPSPSPAPSPAPQPVGVGAFSIYTFTATEGQNQYVMVTELPVRQVFVYVNGIQLHPSTVTVTDLTVSFPALSTGDEVVIEHYYADLVNYPQASNILYKIPTTTSVDRTVQGKILDRGVSVVDFGADPSGLIDSTVAIQNAIDYTYNNGGGEVWLPAGTYKISSTIKLKRHTSLIGPVHRLPTASTYGGNIEATIIGMAKIVPTASLTTCAIMWDYQLTDKLARPYGARLENILLDLTNCAGAVDGVYCRPPPTGEGVFGNGWAGGSTWMYACVIMKAPRYGVFIDSTTTEKVNMGIEYCRIAFSGSHGIYASRCFDMSISYSFSYANGGDGINMYACATERVHNNDVFNNLGHGIVLDGFDAVYAHNAVENNYKHGYYIRASGTTQTDKRYKIIGGRIGTNSYGTDNTYDNVHIEDRAGTACVQILFDAVTFGPQAHVGTVNRVRSQIYCTALPTQSSNTLSNCFVVANDLKTGNNIFNTNTWESFVFDNSIDPAGQLLSGEYRTLTPWTGTASPNVLRGVELFRTANVASATIIGFTAGSSRIEGREVWLLIDDNFTGIDFSSTSLKGNGGVDLPAGASTNGKLIHFKNVDGTNWVANIYG